MNLSLEEALMIARLQCDLAHGPGKPDATRLACFLFHNAQRISRPDSD